jgi:hypothetical protein
MADIASLGIAVDTREVDKGKQALDTLAEAGTRAEGSTIKLTSATGLLAAAARAAAAAYGGLKIAEYIKDATLLNARYETLAVAMKVVGNNAGFSAREMEAQAVALQKTGISMVESRQQILRLVQAQIDLNQASKLARIAQDAAVIGNINSSEAFARLIHGIQTGQTDVLRMIGINVSMEQSYKKMADTLGITTAQLTQAQKTQAVVNAVMQQGEAIAGSYEAAMGTAGKQLNSMQRYLDNLKLTLGETFNEALVIAVEGVTKGLKGANEEATDLATKGQLREWGRDAIRVAAFVVDAFRFVGNSFIQTYKNAMLLYDVTKLVLSGQLDAAKKMAQQRGEEMQAWEKDIGLYGRLADARFKLIDEERKHAEALANSTGAAKKHTEAMVVDADAAKKAANEYKKLIESIKGKIAASQLELSLGKNLTEAQKTSLDAMMKLQNGELQLNKMQKEKLTGLLEELSLMEKLTDQAAFAKNAYDSLTNAGQQQVLSLQDQIDAQRTQNALIGATFEKQLELAGAKEREMAQNLRNAAEYAGPLHGAYMVYANDLETVARLQQDLLIEQQAGKVAQQWMQIGASIEQTGRTAFVQFAAHGISAMASIGQALKMAVFDLLYQITARPWLIKIGTSITNSLTSGIAESVGSSLFSGGSGNLMSALASGGRSILGFFNGGASGLATSFATSSIGEALGLSAVTAGSAFGAGVGTAGASAGTAFIGGAGTALGGSGMAGAALTGAGTAFAALAGPLAILAVADIASRFLAGNKTISNNGVWKTLSAIPILGIGANIINGLFGAGPKKLGPEELTGTFSESGFSGQFEADWKRKTGIFSFAKKKGRRGLGIDPEQDAMLDALVGVTEKPILNFIKYTGDAGRTLQGWTFAIQRQVSTQEQQKQLSQDLADSIAGHLIPELQNLKQEGETLTQTAARAYTEFKLMNAMIDLTGQSFGGTGLSTLGMRDRLVNLLGGVQGAASTLQPFYDEFYTDAEKAASASRLLNKEFQVLGIAVPKTRDEFRKLVEAQNLSTDAGQDMFAALVQLAPAFAQVNQQIEKVTANLSADAFSTLVDYTRYIRLAANGFEVPTSSPDVKRYGVLPSFDVGTNYVPYDMTANIHEGERIIPAADNRDLMDMLSSTQANDTAVVNELQMLRQELRNGQVAIATNLAKMARFMDRWEGIGMPMSRTSLT